MRFKIGGGVTIDEDRERNSRDTSHDGVHQIRGKSHSGKSFLKELSLNSVIGLGHVKLDAHIAMLP
jgi:hypothetical protein